MGTKYGSGGRMGVATQIQIHKSTRCVRVTLRQAATLAFLVSSSVMHLSPLQVKVAMERLFKGRYSF